MPLSKSLLEVDTHKEGGHVHHITSLHLPPPTPVEEVEPESPSEREPEMHPLKQDLNLGVVGNCSFSALITRHGRITWCCMPRLDSDPVFCQLLAGDDDSFGFFDFVVDDFSHATQEYYNNTAILVTTLFDIHGQSLTITDFAPRFKLFGRRFRPVQLMRKVEPHGTPRVTVRCRPSREYHSEQCKVVRGNAHISYEGATFHSRLTTDAPVSFITNEIPFVMKHRYNFIFGSDESIRESPRIIVNEFYEKTLSYWTDWSRGLHIPLEWQSSVIRAAITLKLCTFEESGAVIAAMTTSIPEAADTERTWDYRYCWLRDAFHTVQALNRLGTIQSMEHYLQFIVNIVAGAKENKVMHGDLQPLYGVLMNTDLEERFVDTLKGYRNHSPVRVGNSAYFQYQNDNYGSVILAVLQIFFDCRVSHDIDKAQLFEGLESLGMISIERYDKPDAGLWELRGSEHIHTFSSVMCWAACDRLAHIAKRLDRPLRRKFWRENADKIKTFVMERCWSEKKGYITNVLNGPEEDRDLDASALLLGPLGFIDPKDPMFVKTVDAVGEHLTNDGFCFRYKVEDDFGKPKNSFIVCTFWYIEALAAIGRRDEARALFCKVLQHTNHVGLLSEDIHVQSGELWGNYPQTYSMVGLINTACVLSEDWSVVGL